MTNHLFPLLADDDQVHLFWQSSDLFDPGTSSQMTAAQARIEVRSIIALKPRSIRVQPLDAMHLARTWTPRAGWVNQVLEGYRR